MTVDASSRLTDDRRSLITCCVFSASVADWPRFPPAEMMEEKEELSNPSLEEGNFLGDRYRLVVPFLKRIFGYLTRLASPIEIKDLVELLDTKQKVTQQMPKLSGLLWTQ